MIRLALNALKIDALRCETIRLIFLSEVARRAMEPRGGSASSYVFQYTDKPNYSWIGGFCFGGRGKGKRESSAPPKGKRESSAPPKGKWKRTEPLLRSNSTRQPDRPHARHDTKRCLGWTHPPTSDLCSQSMIANHLITSPPCIDKQRKDIFQCF